MCVVSYLLDASPGNGMHARRVFHVSDIGDPVDKGIRGGVGVPEYRLCLLRNAHDVLQVQVALAAVLRAVCGGAVLRVQGGLHAHVVRLLKLSEVVWGELLVVGLENQLLLILVAIVGGDVVQVV